jgi:hypothetical protein
MSLDSPAPIMRWRIPFGRSNSAIAASADARTGTRTSCVMVGSSLSMSGTLAQEQQPARWTRYSRGWDGQRGELARPHSTTVVQGSARSTSFGAAGNGILVLWRRDGTRPLQAEQQVQGSRVLEDGEIPRAPIWPFLACQRCIVCAARLDSRVGTGPRPQPRGTLLGWRLTDATSACYPGGQRTTTHTARTFPRGSTRRRAPRWVHLLGQ